MESLVDPAAALQGFARAVTIEHLDPDLAAAVDESDQVIQRTPIRYDRTMEYFSAVLIGDARTVIKMSDILMKVHARAYGTNVVTGNEYDSNKSESQLWIHITAWHSILYVYKTFGPGKLSRDEEAEYWDACLTAAAFQPIRPEDVPTSRGAVQHYLDDWRDRLSASEAALKNVDHILDGFETIDPDLPKPLVALGRPLLRWSVIATYPRWMRPMLGVKQGPVKDALSVAVWKPIFAVMSKYPKLYAALVPRICPRAERFIVPAALGIPAKTPKVYKPDVARKAFGDPRTPLEQQADFLAARRKNEGFEAYEHNHKDDIIEFSSTDNEDGSLTLTPQSDQDKASA